MIIPIIDYTLGKSLPQDILLFCVWWVIASFLVDALFFITTSLLYKKTEGWLRKLRAICITFSPVGIVILGIVLPLVVGQSQE